jgi:pimeloyl-ACP methyl ester carboxylesterase
MMRHLQGRSYPMDCDFESAYAREAWERGGGANADGLARQIQAIQASGDRTSALRKIIAPTVVVHGDRDPIVHPSGGRATADAIPGARHISLSGMGHHLAPALIDTYVDLIISNAQGVRA